MTAPIMGPLTEIVPSGRISAPNEEAVDPNPNPYVVEQLRVAEQSRPVLEAAGHVLRGWEPYCLAFTDPDLLRREISRTGPPDPEIGRRLDRLREEIDPLLGKLRQLVRHRETHVQDMLLGFIAGSPAARAAAVRWTAEPERYAQEAVQRLSLIGSIVDRCRSALGVATDPVPPPVPPQLGATASDGQVQLRWTAVPGAVTYTVKRGLAAGGPYLPIANSSGTALSDPTVSNGTSYYYVVNAATPAGESADSAPAEALPLAAPPAPTLLRASVGPGRVTLEWAPSPAAAGYVVLRGELPGPAPTLLAVVTGPPFVDETVRSGSSYAYAVRARNAGGDSAATDSVQAAPPPPAPPTPTGVAAQAGDACVSLRWTASPGATSYRLRRVGDGEAAFEPAGESTTTSFVDAGLENGRRYLYTVAAVNAGGESAPGVPIAAMPLALPPAPADLTATPAAGQVAFTWSAAPGATSYSIRRAPSSAGPFVVIGRTPALAFIDATVPGDRPSVYVVVAENPSGDGPPSAPIMASPLPEAPAAPTGLVGSLGSGVVTLSWNPAERALDYVVRRTVHAAGPFDAVGTVPGTSFTDAAVQDGITYTYQVVALNAGGESAPSEPVSATPRCAPGVPEAPKAVLEGGAVRLSWAAVPGAETYVVRRGDDVVGRVRETSFAETAGPAGTYTIAAANLAGESLPSAPAEAKAPAAPPTPAGMAGSVGDAEVTVRWTASAGADLYRIKRASAREGPFQTVAEVKEPAWTDRSVENGKTYFYTVRAFNAAGKSAYSARLRATPNPRPGAPAGLAAAAGNGEVSLAWRPLDKTTGYKVKRAASAEGPWIIVGTSRHPSWTDRSVQNGTSYWYAVTSVAAAVESEPSTPVAASPAEDASPPTLESLAAPATAPETLPPGVDAEKLEDLRRGEQLRGVFAETGQKFEPWELLTLLAEDGAGARKNIEIVLRLKEQARADQFTAGAMALFERILKVRTAHGGFVRRLREFVGKLDLDGAGPSAGSAALEIALGFLVSAARGRQRAELWIKEGDARRKEAAEFLFHAVGLARNYIAAMQDQNDG